jgi:lipid-A-disaccharide synthase
VIGITETDEGKENSELETQDSRLTIMLVAGEASGDKHGAALARALVENHPRTRFELFGAGGDEMRAAGVETLVDAREVAIIGVPEIARAFSKLYRAYRRLLAAAKRRRPSVVVLIDWPDFNLRLARRLRREGFSVVYYISPQVWAWRRYRVRAIRRDVERMLVILPFEEEFYRGEGVKAEYVGHPLARLVRVTATREEFARRHGLDPARPIVALLPGSRHKEVHYHLPIMLEAAERLRGAERPGLAQFVIPLASTVGRGQVEAIIGEAPPQLRPDLRIIERDTYNAIGHSEIAVVASGTATVETALAGTPMVIVYRGSELNWRLIRPLIRLDMFGMVNLIAGRQVAPELIQHDMTAERVARCVVEILSDPERLARMRRDLAEVRERLQAGGGCGPLLAARAVMEVAVKAR